MKITQSTIEVEKQVIVIEKEQVINITLTMREGRMLRDLLGSTSGPEKIQQMNYRTNANHASYSSSDTDMSRLYDKLHDFFAD